MKLVILISLTYSSVVASTTFEYDLTDINTMKLSHNLSSLVLVSSEQGNNTDCSTDLSPQFLTKDSYDYKVDLNDDYHFGMTTNTDVVFNIKNNRYASASNFKTPITPFRRSLDFVSPSTNYNEAGQTTVSISDCPGNFTNTATCVNIVFPFISMRISTIANDDPNLWCILEPNKSYYFNVVNSPAPYVVSPSCNNSSNTTCALFFTESVE